jgi:hypothetical protein
MRTKTVILTAAVIAAGIGASQAQVYSVNAVGYVNYNIPNGFSLIANPLNTTNNTIGYLLQNVPNFCNFLSWNGTGFDTATYIFGAWDHPEYSLKPGEGGFINTDTPFTITWVGEVMQGSLTNDIPSGFSVRASMVPQAGGVTSVLGLTQLGTFDNLQKWNGTGYDTYTVLPGGGWDPSEPTFNVGEAFFLNTGGSASWTRTFSVN